MAAIRTTVRVGLASGRNAGTVRAGFSGASPRRCVVSLPLVAFQRALLLLLRSASAWSHQYLIRPDLLLSQLKQPFAMALPVAFGRSVSPHEGWATDNVSDLRAGIHNGLQYSSCLLGFAA